MLHRGQVVDVGSAEPVGRPPEKATPGERRPRLSGALPELIGNGPCFRTAVRGYDRLEVDNYVAWAEDELATAQREREHLLDRVATCAADLAISRRLLAERPTGRLISDRVVEVLRLAEQQAAQVLDAADAEAGRIVADARLEADARLRKAHEIKEQAIAAADQLRTAAQEDREAAAALLARAGSEADVLLQRAAEERERLAGEAAQERDRAAAEAARDRDRIAAEVADLQRQTDLARATLRGLTERLGEALRVVGVSDPERRVPASGSQEPVPA